MAKVSYRKRFTDYGGTENLDDWRKVFVESSDPTGYTAAVELLGSWKEWEGMLTSWPAFTRDILPVWLNEQEIYMRSHAIRGIAESDNTNDLKWIAEKKWKDKKPGPPTQAEKARREMVDNSIDDDVERVMRIHAVD